MHGDWGMGAEEESRTHPGEKDYTGHTGDESRTHPGELDYEGGDVEHKAMAAMKAIHDLASAAGVELQTDVSGPGDLDAEEETLAMENKMRVTKKQLQRIIREEAARLHEDRVDDELDNLKKNVHDDIEHIRDLKDDVEEDREEEERAHEVERRHNESRRRTVNYIRRLVKETVR
jgi:hypothetical protein